MVMLVMDSQPRRSAQEAELNPSGAGVPSGFHHRLTSGNYKMAAGANKGPVLPPTLMDNSSVYVPANLHKSEKARLYQLLDLKPGGESESSSHDVRKSGLLQQRQKMEEMFTQKPSAALPLLPDTFTKLSSFTNSNLSNPKSKSGSCRPSCPG